LVKTNRYNLLMEPWLKALALSLVSESISDHQTASSQITKREKWTARCVV
jgi:hypothetical protein